jgi:hypothetical protein
LVSTTYTIGQRAHPETELPAENAGSAWMNGFSCLPSRTQPEWTLHKQPRPTGTAQPIWAKPVGQVCDNASIR